MTKAEILGEIEAWLLDLMDGPIPPPPRDLRRLAAWAERRGCWGVAMLIRPNKYLSPPSRAYLQVQADSVARERAALERAAGAAE